jgi:UDP-N-acetyl-2-amino-2-deoxyglucuronate dehydrogenase
LNKPLRFGILGCGAIGPTHAGAIRQLGLPITAVADPVSSRAQDLAARFDVRSVYSTVDRLVADPDVDVVCVCTPSGMHADHAVAAMNAGKHVIVEKPMEISLHACDRIIDTQARTARLLTVISQHRFDQATQLARKLITDGRLGSLVLATADVKWFRTQSYYDSGDWRGTWHLDGGGALMNQGVHTVDLLQWLVGGVASVRALTRTRAHTRIEVEDVAALLLEFNNGAVGTLTATTAAFDGYPVRIEIFGTEGSILLEGDAVKRILLKDGTTFDAASAASHALRVAQGGTASVKDEALDRPTAAFGAQWGDAHRAQIQDFVNAIHSRSSPLIDAHAGREPVRIILDAYASARSSARA